MRNKELHFIAIGAEREEDHDNLMRVFDNLMGFVGCLENPIVKGQVLACKVCQRFAHRCAVRDGMQEIYPLFAECDTVVMASPLYFWTITAKLKAFIERLNAISVEDKYPSKDTVLIMTAGDDKDVTFDEPKRYFRIISQVLGDNKKGVYCAGGCTGCEKLAREIDNKHLANAYQMGLEL